MLRLYGRSINVVKICFYFFLILYILIDIHLGSVVSPWTESRQKGVTWNMKYKLRRRNIPLSSGHSRPGWMSATLRRTAFTPRSVDVVLVWTETSALSNRSQTLMCLRPGRSPEGSGNQPWLSVRTTMVRYIGAKAPKRKKTI